MATPKLFTPLKVGRYELAHRVVLAPLTRCRSDEEGVPTALMAHYYAQRTTQAALMISEATQISQEGQGIPNTPGMFNMKQVEGWKLITEAVHEKGGFIFAQLWHMGRQSHSSFQPDGGPPVAPSPVPGKATSRITLKTGERVPYEVPRAFRTEEIPRLIADYVHASRMALAAGFDGIEVHGANGYLLDQFLHNGTNLRTDKYGGSIANRVRLLVEVTEAIVNVWGRDRVGVRLSPPVYLEDTDREALFNHAISEISNLNIAYLHLLDPQAYTRFGFPLEETKHLTAGFFRPVYKGVLIENGRIGRQSGIDLVETDGCDAVSYGVPFISNPDLVDRLRNDFPLAEADPATYYTPGPKGLTDYPTYSEACSVEREVEKIAPAPSA